METMPRRCATVPLPWGLLPLCALVLLAGDAFCRAFLPVALANTAYAAPGLGERVFLRFLAGGLIVGWWALVLAELGQFSAAAVHLYTASGAVLDSAAGPSTSTVVAAIPR